MQTSERVVVIKGNASNWYSQAVFILNPGVQASNTSIDFVAEAEKIIFDYMAKKNGHSLEETAITHNRPTQQDGKVKRYFPPSIVLHILMGLACIGMAAIIGFRLLS
ncbi:MAG: hypothetical protein FWC92_11380 [Defluviitaleaceae bacterium]|nr:hypothetical protein [Defluviitaleaceae bacterium]